MKKVVGLVLIGLVGLVKAETNKLNRADFIPEPSVLSQVANGGGYFNLNNVPTVNAVDIRVFIDGNGNVMALAGVDPVEARRQAREGTFWQRTGEHFKNNWAKYLVGTGTFVVVDRVSANNNWLWHDWFGGSGGSGDRSYTKTNQQEAQRDNIYFEVTGDGNTVNVRGDETVTTTTTTTDNSVVN